MNSLKKAEKFVLLWEALFQRQGGAPCHGEVNEDVGTYPEVLTPFLVYTDAASLKYIVNLKSEETII